VTADRLRSAIAAAEAERGRWARELHDQTLQSLGALRVGLASIRGGLGDGEPARSALTETIGDVETEIANLRAIIADLRPAILDDLGLIEALEALLDRHRSSGLEINSSITLEGDATQVPWDPTLEITIYRLLQEAMTNVVKHASATAVSVTVGLSESGDAVTVEVSDNGGGFDAGGLTDGFGLAGLRERVFLAGGQIEVHSTPAGTQLSARLPVSRRRRAEAILIRRVVTRRRDDGPSRSAPARLASRARACGESARGASRRSAARGTDHSRSRCWCDRAR
jgi:signal transduction histidine kinase